LAGRPLLAHTLVCFERSELIQEIVLVVPSHRVEEVRSRFLPRFGFRKVRKVVAGGATRQESVYEGLTALEPPLDLVVVHDGARPLVKAEAIRSCVEAAARYGAVVQAVPITDTIKEADEEGRVRQTLDRSCLWSVQTPQVFSYDLLLRAHQAALREGFEGTDDASLVERMGAEVRILRGSYENLKITSPEDLLVAEWILQRRKA